MGYKVKKYRFEVYKADNTTTPFFVEVPALSETHAFQTVQSIYDKSFSLVDPAYSSGNLLIELIGTESNLQLDGWHIRETSRSFTK